MQRSLPLAYQEGSKHSFTCNALTDSFQGVQKCDFVTLVFPGADSFQTCCFHHGYCSLLPRLLLTWQGLQQGSNHPAEQFRGRVKESQRWRPTALMSCWRTAGPTNHSITVGRTVLQDLGWERKGLGADSENASETGVRELCRIREQRVMKKGTWKTGAFQMSWAFVLTVSVRTLSLQ